MKRYRGGSEVQTSIEDLSREVKDAEILEIFIRQVVQGITALKKQLEDRSQRI